jgi:hypothetical protein
MAYLLYMWAGAAFKDVLAAEAGFLTCDVSVHFSPLLAAWTSGKADRTMTA